MDNLHISFKLDDPARGKPLKGGGTIKDSMRQLDKHINQRYNTSMKKILGLNVVVRRIRNRRRVVS